MKKWYTSKTIWVAVLQAVVGILLAYQDYDPALDLAGYVAIIKSAIDILLRMKTDTRIM